MPGIAAIIPKHQGGDHAVLLDRMLAALRHQPDYCSTSLHNEQLRFWAGGVSHPGGFDDCLPIWNESRDAGLIFSGEVFPETIEPANASYLIHQYEESGLNFLEQLNGGFSGILFDLRKQRIVLFNDRYGLNRIYVHEDEAAFYFCSEAKGLLQIKPELRCLDPRGFGEFLSSGCVFQNRTLFSGIGMVPPGSNWEFSPGHAPKRQTYFSSTAWEQQSVLSSSNYYDEFRDAWKRVVPRYFRGNHTVGLSLTGGVDSRMILAWAPKSARPIPCYTFAGSYRDCADVKISREVAKLCRTPYQTIPVGQDFLSRFPDLAEQSIYQSDGSVDVLGAIDLYLQEAACRIAPVRVTGTNGGEVLRRLVVFKPARLTPGLLSADLDECVRTAENTYTELLNGHPLTFTAFKQAPWFMASKFALERSRLTLRMPYFDNELIKLVYRAPEEFTRDNTLSLKLSTEGNPGLAHVPTDRGGAPSAAPAWAAARGFIQEFSFKAEYAYDSGMPQWLAKLDHAVAPLHLERLFLGRHKFSHFRVWYRDQLAGYVRDVLLSSRTLSRPYWNGAAVERMVIAHLTGAANYTFEIHKILTAELIIRKLIETN